MVVRVILQVPLIFDAVNSPSAPDSTWPPETLEQSPDSDRRIPRRDEMSARPQACPAEARPSETNVLKATMLTGCSKSPESSCRTSAYHRADQSQPTPLKLNHAGSNAWARNDIRQTHCSYLACVQRLRKEKDCSFRKGMYNRLLSDPRCGRRPGKPVQPLAFGMAGTRGGKAEKFFGLNPKRDETHVPIANLPVVALTVPDCLAGRWPKGSYAPPGRPRPVHPAAASGQPSPVVWRQDARSAAGHPLACYTHPHEGVPPRGGA